MAEVRLVAADPEDAAGLRLLADYEAELVGLGVRIDHTWGGGVRPDHLREPRGAWLIGRSGAEAVACGGVRLLEPGVCEIKRMYVAPSARGAGLARRLLTELEARGARLGATVARLDTGQDMSAALALYRGAGYREIEDYNGNPDAGWWLEKVI